MALELARRSLALGAPEAALQEAREAEQSAADAALAAEAVGVQALALLVLGRPVEAEQLLAAARPRARGAAELQLLSAQSSCALAQQQVAQARQRAQEGGTRGCFSLGSLVVDHGFCPLTPRSKGNVAHQLDEFSPFQACSCSSRAPSGTRSFTCSYSSRWVTPS